MAQGYEYRPEPLPTPNTEIWGKFAAPYLMWESEAKNLLKKSGAALKGYQESWSQYDKDLEESKKNVNNLVKQTANISSTNTFPANTFLAYLKPSAAYASSSPSIPSNYTGWIDNTPYVRGKVQTGGGGFTPEGTYSAGYHGSGTGAKVDMGRWGTGKDMGPMVDGTVQTGGGDFYYDKKKGTWEYSAGYHGSGEHPEITGSTLPGTYERSVYGATPGSTMMRDPFGSIISPHVSNTSQVGDVLQYLQLMGYNVENINDPARNWTSDPNGTDWNRQENRQKIVDEFNSTGGRFDMISFLRKLDRGSYNPKTEILAILAQNPNMATQEMYNIVGGVNYSKLGGNLWASSGSHDYK